MNKGKTYTAEKILSTLNNLRGNAKYHLDCLVKPCGQDKEQISYWKGYKAALDLLREAIETEQF